MLLAALCFVPAAGSPFFLSYFFSLLIANASTVALQVYPRSHSDHTIKVA